MSDRESSSDAETGSPDAPFPRRSCGLSFHKPSKFNAEVVHYDCCEGYDSPILATSGGDMHLIFTIPKEKFRKMAESALSFLHDSEEDLSDGGSSDSKKGNGNSGEGSSPRNLEKRSTCQGPTSEASEPGSIRNDSLKYPQFHTAESLAPVQNEEANVGNSGNDNITNLEDESKDTEIARIQGIADEGNGRLENSRSDFRTSEKMSGIPGQGASQGKVDFMHGCEKNGSAVGSSTNIGLILEHDSAEEMGGTVSNAKSSPDVEKVQIRETRGCGEKCIMQDVQPVRREIEDLLEPFDKTDHAVETTDEENVSYYANLSAYSLDISGGSCPELESAWPDIRPFNETETIPLTELTSCESATALTKYFKLELSSEFVVIRVSNEDSKLLVDAVKYKESGTNSGIGTSECTSNSLNSCSKKDISETETLNQSIKKKELKERGLEKERSGKNESSSTVNMATELNDDEKGMPQLLVDPKDICSVEVGVQKHAENILKESSESNSLPTCLHDAAESEEQMNPLLDRQGRDSQEYTFEKLKPSTAEILKTSENKALTTEIKHAETNFETNDIRSSENTISVIEENKTLNTTLKQDSNKDTENKQSTQVISLEIELNSEGGNEMGVSGDISPSAKSNFSLEYSFRKGDNEAEKNETEESNAGCSESQLQTKLDTEISSVNDIKYLDPEIPAKSAETVNNVSRLITSSPKCNPSGDDGIESLSKTISEFMEDIISDTERELSFNSSKSNQNPKDESSNSHNSFNDIDALTDSFLASDTSLADLIPSEELGSSKINVFVENGENSSVKEVVSNNSKTCVSESSITNIQMPDDNLSKNQEIGSPGKTLMSGFEDEGNSSIERTIDGERKYESSKNICTKNANHLEDVTQGAESGTSVEVSDGVNEQEETFIENCEPLEETDVSNTIQSPNELAEEKVVSDSLEKNVEKEIGSSEKTVIEDPKNKSFVVEESINTSENISTAVKNIKEIKVDHESDTSQKSTHEEEPSKPISSEEIGIPVIVPEFQDLEQSKVENNVQDTDEEASESAAEATSEGDTLESEVKSITSESEDGRDLEEMAKSENSELNSKLKTDETDCAPTRDRRRKARSGLSKEVIPEHSVVTKSAKNTKAHNADVGHSKINTRTLTNVRSLRSKSLDPAPQQNKIVTRDRTTGSNVPESESTRKKRAATPDLIKKDIKTALRSSPRKAARSAAVNPAGLTTTSTPKSLSTRSTAAAESNGKPGSNLDVSVSSVTRRPKRNVKE